MGDELKHLLRERILRWKRADNVRRLKLAEEDLERCKGGWQKPWWTYERDRTSQANR